LVVVLRIAVLLAPVARVISMTTVATLAAKAARQVLPTASALRAPAVTAPIGRSPTVALPIAAHIRASAWNVAMIVLAQPMLPQAVNSVPCKEIALVPDVCVTTASVKASKST